MPLMKSKLWTVLAACLCGTVLLSGSKAAQPKEKLKGVDTRALLNRPQDYWSVGISYKDTVQDAGGKQIKILNTTYYSVNLKEIGTAYASEQGLNDIEKNGVNREYILTGTVLHDQRGLFKKTDQYFIIILEAVPAVITDTAEIERGLNELSLSDDHPETRYMLDVFSSTQRDLINLARELEVPVEELFKKDSKNREEAKDLVRRALRKLEINQDIPSQEILSGFIFHMLSKKFSNNAVDHEPKSEDIAPPDVEAGEELAMDFSLQDEVTFQKAPVLAIEDAGPDQQAPLPAAPAPSPTPAAALNPALLNTPPLQTVRPRLKVRFPAKSFSLPRDEDIFAPVGR